MVVIHTRNAAMQIYEWSVEGRGVGKVTHKKKGSLNSCNYHWRHIHRREKDKGFAFMCRIYSAKARMMLF